MPYYAQDHVPVFVTDCCRAEIISGTDLNCGPEDNMILQFVSENGICTIKGTERKIPLRSLLFLKRNSHVSITSTDKNPVQVIRLVYSNTRSMPYIDLNLLCMRVLPIDMFFLQKKEVTLIPDQQHIYMTFQFLLYEWEQREIEYEVQVSRLMEILLLQIARSFAETKKRGMPLITNARRYIMVHYQEHLTISEIASACGISSSYLELLFKQTMNCTVTSYVQKVHCEHAAFLLSTTNFSAIEIAFEVGFNNRQHFARVFRSIMGETPREYRQEHQFIGDRKG